jgi:hypothetical protein
MTDSLIEKLEALRPNADAPELSERAYRQAIDDCIGVVRQHMPVVRSDDSAEGRRIDQMVLSKALDTHDPALKTSIGEVPMVPDFQVDCVSPFEQPDDCRAAFESIFPLTHGGLKAGEVEGGAEYEADLFRGFRLCWERFIVREIRRDQTLVTWVKTSERMPDRNHHVIVEGGLAKWTGEKWVSLMSDTPYRTIIWEVLYWTPLITPPLTTKLDIEDEAGK